MSQFKHKRNKAALTILAAAVGIGAVTLNPSSSLEMAKQIFITIADVAMCIMLWDIYFDEDLAQKSIQAILSDLCLITLTSIITAFILAKGTIALMNYLVHLLGSTGWIFAGVFSALITAILGIGWTFYCDDISQSSKS